MKASHGYAVNARPHRLDAAEFTDGGVRPLAGPSAFSVSYRSSERESLWLEAPQGSTERQECDYRRPGESDEGPAQEPRDGRTVLVRLAIGG